MCCIFNMYEAPRDFTNPLCRGILHRGGLTKHLGAFTHTEQTLYSHTYTNMNISVFFLTGMGEASQSHDTVGTSQSPYTEGLCTYRGLHEASYRGFTKLLGASYTYIFTNMHISVFIPADIEDASQRPHTEGVLQSPWGLCEVPVYRGFIHTYISGFFPMDIGCSTKPLYREGFAKYHTEEILVWRALQSPCKNRTLESPCGGF